MEDKLNVLAPEVAKVDEIDKNNLTVVLEPFERGFGYTIGHSLRRIMLSYMPGAAVTEVKIDGVSHEYGTIEGIKEDILDVCRYSSAKITVAQQRTKKSVAPAGALSAIF